eukprot:1575895-Pyramimonas_sp.AAC.1
MEARFHRLCTRSRVADEVIADVYTRACAASRSLSKSPGQKNQGIYPVSPCFPSGILFSLRRICGGFWTACINY